MRADGVGFYLFIAGCLLSAAIAYVRYCNIGVEEYGTMYSAARSMAFKGVWTSIGKIVLFMLLMLLRCDGKNVYQVLWNKSNYETYETCISTFYFCLFVYRN